VIKCFELSPRLSSASGHSKEGLIIRGDLARPEVEQKEKKGRSIWGEKNIEALTGSERFNVRVNSRLRSLDHLSLL